jgi:DhnA family fructose-bisphosphate aldolase class Ia
MAEFRLGTFIHDGCVYEVYVGKEPSAQTFERFAEFVQAAKRHGDVPAFDGNCRVVQTFAAPRAGACLEVELNGYTRRYAARSAAEVLELKAADEAADRDGSPVAGCVGLGEWKPKFGSYAELAWRRLASLESGADEPAVVTQQ